jgi:hypothetical protein
MRKYLVFSFLLLSIAFADGGFFHEPYPDYYIHVYEPEQKAVIHWDGNTETMILSVRVQTDELANMALVIPIPSKSQPEVEEGDIDIFYDIAEIFMEEEYHYDYEEDLMTPGAGEYKGVEVIETKKIDVHDITVLRATEADELVKWLNDNSYHVPDSTVPVLQEYCDKENYYFIADKINLRNEYKDEIEAIEQYA